MKVEVELDDDADKDQVASVIEAVQSGRFIALRRPDSLSNEQVGSFCVQAKLVLDGMVAENALLEHPDLLRV
jgi:hypothetical protein